MQSFHAFPHFPIFTKASRTSWLVFFANVVRDWSWGEVLPGSGLQGNVPGRKWVTVGIDSPLVRDIGVK